MGLRLPLNKIVLALALIMLSVFSVFALQKDISNAFFSLLTDPVCKPTLSANGPVSFCIGGKVTLTSSVKGAGYSYTWFRNNVEIKDQKGESLVVSESGDYSVLVDDKFECQKSNEVSDRITVTVNPLPVADFTFTNNETCAGTTVRFTNTSAGTGLSYSWDFGDGSAKSSLPSPSHVFNTIGSGTTNYKVVLTVTSDKGCSVYVQKEVKVKEVVSIDLRNVQSFRNCTGQTFNLIVDDNSAAPDAKEYTIDWGDGTAPYQSSIAPMDLAHSYPIGIYKLKYTIKGKNDCVVTKEISVYNITNPAVSATSSGNTTGCGPLSITFPITNVADNHPSTVYTIDFGDGSPKQEFKHPAPASVTHVYTKSSCGSPGSPPTFPADAYIFTITAKNACGETPAAVGGIKVYSAPQAKFEVSTQNLCINSNILFTNTTVEGSNFDCNNSSTYTWDFGDGTIRRVFDKSNQSYVYKKAGTYKVSLKSENACGFTLFEQTIEISEPPKASFIINPASGVGCKDFTVTPNNTSVGDNISYTWSISPNTGYTLANGTLNSANPVFNFKQIGNYVITLVAKNSCGSTTASKEITVKDVPSVALPGAKSYCGPQTVKFDASSTFHKPVYTANNGTITAYAWTVTDNATFTGGTNSASAYPEISFPKSGSYTVTLKATNECGTSGTATQVITINEPAIAPTVASVTVCKGGTASLRASGSGPTYNWYTAESGGTVLYTGDTYNVSNVSATVTYYVGAINAAGCPSVTRTPVTITVDQPVTGNSIGSSKSICVNTEAPTLIGSTPGGGNGDFSYTWQSKVNNGTYVIAKGTSDAKDYAPGALTQTTTYRRMVKSGACGESYSNEVTIATQVSPIAPTVAGAEICSGSTATLKAPLVSGITYRWYDVATGGAALKTGEDFTTPVLTNDVVYYLEAFNSTGCASNTRTIVTVKVNQPVTDNILSENQSICAGATSAAILGTAPKGGNGTYSYRWYKSTSGSTGGFTVIPNEIGKDLYPGAVSVKTWYQREVISGGCTSKSAVVEISVKPAPAAPTVAGQTICKGGSTTLTASAPGGKYTWYDKDGKILAEGANTLIITTLDATTDYFVGTEVDGCTSATRTKVTVTVQEPITNNTIAENQSLCIGQAAAPLLGSTPTGASGNYIYRWESSTTSASEGFKDAAGTNKGKDYTPGALTQTTWFRRVVASGVCSEVTSNVIRVEVTQSIAENTITGDQVICENSSPAKFTGTSPTGGLGTYAYTWESSTTSSSTGFQVIANATGPDFTSAGLTQTTWFRRSVTSGQCTVGSNVIKVTVEKKLSGNSITANQTICKGSSAASLNGGLLTGGSGAYSYLWQSSTDGKDYIEASGSNTGQHYSPGLVGETTWFRRKVSSGICDPTFSEPIKVTVSEPIANNNIDENGILPICSGSTPARLIGSNPTGGDGIDFRYQWESSTVSGTSGFGNATGEATLKDYNPDPLFKTTWFRRKVTSGACSAVSDAVRIEVKDLSAAPTVKGQAVCAGASATLTASGAADSFEWYKVAIGGVAVHKGVSYTTDPLAETTIFYVQAVANGCASPTRTAVEVRVEQPISNNKIGQAQEICAGAVPAALKGDVPAGGDGKFIYSWLSSTDNISFEAAPGANTGEDYTPPALGQNTYFKRVVTSGVCQQSESNTILVTANPSLTNNTIGKEQEICYGLAPAVLVGSLPEGGDKDYKYTWQSSTASGTTGFVDASGINNTRDYSAGALVVSTWFRRIVRSGGCEIPSPVIKVTVNPLPAAPVVSGKEICKGAMTSLSVTDAGGTYSWYDKAEAGTLLHTGTTYETPILDITTTYYVQVTDAKGCASARAAVTVKVNPLIANNAISENQAVCTGEKPADLLGTLPTGGNGSYTFLWEQSFNNKDYEPATGTNTSRDYQISSIGRETWYRRRVVSGNCESFSNIVQVVVNGEIADNNISAPQTICTGKTPIALSGTIPSGGNGSYTYRWEISTNGPTGIFTSAPEVNNLEGYVSGPLTRTTWFRRVVTSGACSDYSATIEIKVNENIGNNLITSDQTICNGSNASVLVGSLPTGGSGTYTYVWEVSTLSATDGFTMAPGMSSELNYTPEALTQTSWFRRRVLSGPCGEHTSDAVKITVNGAITANTISDSQIICFGTAPAELRGSAPIGGSGSYIYLWEYSTEGETMGFKAAPGMNNGEGYQAGALTQTTWFRRTVLSAPCPSLSSNAVKITVNPVITENNIAGAQTVCSGDVPALLAGSDPKGGDGVYVYLWEYSKDGVTYETASGKTNASDYQPAALTHNAWFRRVVTSGYCTSVSDEIMVAVNQPITDNLISGDQDICLGATPVAFTASDPVGGDGKYTYLWESSTVGPNSGFTTAAGISNRKSYEPEAITNSTWFRRVVSGGVCPPSSSNAVKITVTPPIANNRISSPQSVCSGVTPAPLTGTKPTGGTGDYRYLWESSKKGPTSGFSPAGGINNEATYDPGQLPVTTWFRRAAYSGGCVSASVAIQVTVLPQLTGNSISQDQTLCLGSAAATLLGSTPVGGSGAYAYRWESSMDNITFSPAAGINDKANYSPGLVGQTTWYKRVVFSEPCSEMESNVVKLTINAPISNNTIGAAQVICTGTAPSVLQGTRPEGGSGVYSYLWEFSTTSAISGFRAAPGSNNSDSYQSGSLDRTTWFRRVVTSLPCTENKSEAIAVTVIPLPVAPKVQGVTICPDMTASINASSSENGVYFEWYDHPTEGNMLHTGGTYTTGPLSATTDFFVQAVNTTGCASQSRVKVTVVVQPSTADAGLDITIIKGQNTGLHGKGGETYKWSPAKGLSNPNISNPIATPDETTTYTLTVTSKSGCVYTDEVIVSVIPRIDPTNAITMSGDNINDTWIIRNIEHYPNCRVQIYTRWGALVFESSGYKQNWDGIHDGKALPMGVYYYIIDLGMNEKPISGSITLIK
ncbi:gliding motility-associated C-terminal domain-containing protein [Rufibacter roseolus]|uniref:gliding motility-associated C-terminal domain-containing protein n=1 Tax=Rufibacter roseolus TaxID=2817375 RepID=UPI001B313874|nr:gliding motility-associated C-terminal domain-containing protein [Rufibacter roseolus]